jgi:peptidoglycan hydrolase-like protein with peptidoglycan-binding domain
MRSLMRRVSTGVLGLVAIATVATLVSAGSAGASVSSTAAARTPASSAWHPSTTWPYVRPGNRGERVVAVQFLLQGKGYRVAADGIYGPITTRAVQRFQRANHLNPSGNVGPSTWARLVVTVRRGSRGSAVAAVQHNLRFAYGFRRLPVTGFFGRNTQAAVIFFQRVWRIVPRNGVVGTSTWKTLVTNER